ncbi:MAG: hypothetical protein A2474_05405 [Elusimicrobia bacterium RIFOXYC2_FULL_34_12]|nr:MAG: hypothetical protein A2474_05405 [Elusimicrobia bacterium RIFOXYC2_FULL_34_12]OGS38007.1 MAG: hypothetical protein A2551_04925 [Elusimicrobia bacterium RIFOXYD2_FULL_34_30]HAM38687.1 hypothetical protein [Elusimicrobiota bacterium]
MAEFRRKIILVDKKLQLKYAFIISGVLIFMLLLVEYHTYLTINLAIPNLLTSAVGDQIKQIHFWLIINGIVYALFIAVVSIYISHKIAGPVYKIKKQLREIMQTGDTSKKIFIRKGDELADLVEIINEYISKTTLKK